MRRSTVVLVVLVVLTNLAAQAYALPMASFIRDRSTSIVTDTALRFVYFALMLLVSAIEVLLIDDLFFGGGWRAGFLGSAPAGPRRAEALSDEALEDLAAAGASPHRAEGGLLRMFVAQSLVPFFVVLFAALLVNYYVFNLVNGGFDRYYGKIGHLVTQLRSSDPKARQDAILELSIKRHDQVEPLLAARLAQGTPEEKRWAAWALGYRRRLKLPPPPLEVLEGIEDSLVALVEKGTEAQQRVAVVALARFVVARGDDAAGRLIPAVRRLLEQQQARGQIPVESVLAVGLLRETSTLPVLGPLLADRDEKRALAAAWALGHMESPAAADALQGALGAAEPQVRCAIVAALALLGQSPKTSKVLMDQFNWKRSDFRCRPVTFGLRPDGRGREIPDTIILAKTAELYRVMILRTLAKTGFLADAMPWLERIGQADSPYPQTVQQYAREYARALRKQLSQGE
jgi:hypothetical protein